MQEEDNQVHTKGENVGFIKRFNNKQEIKTQNMVQKAASMVTGGAAGSFKRISPASISKLDLNEIGDSEDSVVELQEQLKRELDVEKSKDNMKFSLVQKLSVKKEAPRPSPQPAAPAQQAI